MNKLCVCVQSPLHERITHGQVEKQISPRSPVASVSHWNNAQWDAVSSETEPSEVSTETTLLDINVCERKCSIAKTLYFESWRFNVCQQQIVKCKKKKKIELNCAYTLMLTQVGIIILKSNRCSLNQKWIRYTCMVLFSNFIIYALKHYFKHYAFSLKIVVLFYYAMKKRT